MNDENKNNEPTPDQILLQEVRSRKLLGKDDRQINDELISTYQAEDIQKALQALRYMNVTNDISNEYDEPSDADSAIPVESTYKLYAQHALRIIITLVSYYVVSYLLRMVLMLVWPAALMPVPDTVVITPNLFISSTVDVFAAVITFYIFRNRFGLTAYTVLFTVLAIAIFRNAAIAIYMAKEAL